MEMACRDRWRAAFEALTPGRQQGYRFHFNEAKPPATRAARIEKAMPAILAGRGFLERRWAHFPCRVNDRCSAWFAWYRFGAGPNFAVEARIDRPAIGGEMRRLLSVGAAVVALSLVASAASASELVANGGFTTGDFTGWTTFSANGGNLGYSVDPRVVSFDVTGGGASDAAEFQVGSNAPGNQEGGGISQAIHTVGGELDFTADWALIGGTAGENGSGGVFSVLLDGVTLDSFNTGDVPGFPNVVRGSLAFGATVTAGTHILALQITRPYTVGFSDGYTPVQYFDDVSAVQAGGAVPEPQTWALMLGGFGLAGAALRRRRAPLAA